MINYSRSLLSSHLVSAIHEYTIRHPIEVENQDLTVTVNNGFDEYTDVTNGKYVKTLHMPTINISLSPHYKYNAGTIYLNGIDTGVTSITDYVVNSDLLVTASEATEIPNNVIGVEYTKSTNTWKRINSHGNEMVISNASVLNSIPVLSGIEDATIDGCAMVKIPKFYYLYQNTNDAHRIWVDVDEFSIDGVGTATVHPAFVVNNNTINQFYIAAYEASTDTNDTSKITSKYNVAALGNLTINEFRAMALARNVNGVTGFDLMNAYQIAAIQMLLLIDLGNPDTKTAIGPGAYSGGKKNTGKTDAVWRGIHELWGNLYDFVWGLKLIGGTYKLYDEANDTYVSTGVSTLNDSEGQFVLDISPTLVRDYGIILPVSTIASDASSMFMFNKQYLRTATTTVYTLGGSYTTGSATGPFTLAFETAGDNYKHAKQGARLSKI